MSFRRASFLGAMVVLALPSLLAFAAVLGFCVLQLILGAL
jgi:hypothetical protein